MSPSGSVVNTEYLWIMDNTSRISSSSIPSVNSSHRMPSRKSVKGSVPSSDGPVMNLYALTNHAILFNFNSDIAILTNVGFQHLVKLPDGIHTDAVAFGIQRHVFTRQQQIGEQTAFLNSLISLLLRFMLANYYKS